MKNQYQLSGDEEDPQLLDGLTAGTSQQAPPTPMPTPPPTMAPPPATSTPTPAAAAPASAPPPQLPGMPPDMTPDTLAPYLNQQKAQISKFGPQEQMALQNNLNARQNSFGNRATEGLKGFADALMMGVARAGNPGFQQQYQAQENQYAQDQKSTLDKARAANVQNVESGMTMDKMNPSSPLSKSSQDAYAPLFEKLGYPPDKIKGMSASNIDNTLQLMAAYGGKEIEAKIKEYELQIENKRMEAALSNVQSEAENRKQQRNFEERKLKTEHPILNAVGMLPNAESESSSAATPSSGWKYIGKVNK